MRAAKKLTVDRKLLQELVPLNALSLERFREVSEKIIIEEVLAGCYLFRKGDRDNQSIYLLEGKVNLIDGFRKVTSEVEAGTDVSRYPIANQQPRSLSARAVKKVVIAKVDSSLLDVFLTWDQSSSAEVVEIGAETNKDWMTRILQSEAFIKIPPSMIQSLLIKMEALPVKAGEVVIRQGDSGDYFYTIHEGRCEVSQKASSDGEARLLAELSDGDSFGEDALVSDAKRNATVSMLTDGLLMRLAKKDFVELLKNQLVRRVDYEQAAAMIDDGAVWVDVRTPDEYENGAFEDSVNIPLSRLRDELSELVFNSKYIICCDTGRRSESAGFLLSHKGFDVYVLEGGIPGLSSDAVEPVVQGNTSDPIYGLAEVIEFDGGTREADNQVESETVADDDKTQKNPDRHEVVQDELRAENRELTVQMETYRASEIRLTEQLELLRGELGESGEKLGVLYAQAKIDAMQLEQLRAELGESGNKLSVHYAKESEAADEIQLLQDQYHALQEEFTNRVSVHEQEIVHLQDRLAEMQSRAESASDGYQSLLGEAAAIAEAQQAAERENQQRLQQQQQESDEQLRTLREALEQQQQQFSETLEAQAATAETMQALQRDNEILRTELRDSGVQMDEQKEQLGNLLADRQAAAEAIQRQQSEWEVERAALQQSLEGEQQVVTGLREELSLAELQSREDRSALETELKALLDKSNGNIEQLEIKQIELKQEQSSLADELEIVVSERIQLQQQLSDSEEQNGKLESEIESLKQQAESLVCAADEKHQQLQAQLEQEQAKTGSAEQSSEEKDAQIASLQEQLAQHGAGNEALRLEHEVLQQQLNDLRLHLEQQENRAKALEEENKESIKKAHEDLTRKNDNEKELQGQIDRLRKKLEQQTIDHKKALQGAQEDSDNMREQLHAERQARADERSEMAARQRELKEQLAVIATEHETKLTNQTGAIEQARYAARQEEQERLRELLAIHVETEDQVTKLQQELKKAHEEIAELARHEKDRRQIDIDLMEEQNQQAIATITQLELQLKKFTEERDAALEQQQLLRNKMNALRGEVEVARGLMGACEQVEDPEKLRKELNESKKNIEIALRLRAEAEAVRDRALQERDALQQQLKSDGLSSEPLHVPSLDEGVTSMRGPGPEQRSVLPVIPPEREQDGGQQSLVDGERDNRQRRWLGATIGLGAVIICALAGWLFIDADIPEAENNAVQQLPVVKMPDTETVREVPGDLPVVNARQAMPHVEDAVEAAPATVEISTPVPDPDAGKSPVLENEPQVKPPLEEPVRATLQAPVIAGRLFRENLQSGGQGPVMVELPAGSYEMGSIGNSLNFDEGPRHQVKLAAFSISKFEVTFAEYDRFARATGRRLPYDESWGRAERPAINVSWDDARAYSRWLSEQTGKNYRLPSEAEWEYATRAGSVGNFWWRDAADNLHANCFNCGSEWDSMRTAPVGSFAANDFGLHDVAGNVQEWTADCYHGSYHDAPGDGSAWQFPECTMRVVRGGAYTSPLDSLRSAKRSQYDQNTRLDNLGFRVAREN